ncbi:alpha/beta hydrolase [Endomicrobium sp. AH-315-J14]|nr:alpha/beta hydrolase [Endomicrobium sp. AH-315-J14]
MNVEMADGLELYVRQSSGGGVGPPVVMVHGWMMSGAVWDQVGDDLGQHELFISDQRGTGQSGRSEDGYSLLDLAHDQLAIMDRLGHERFAVVGHSMGGQVAQIVASLAPDRVSKLVLVNTVPASGLDLPPETRSFMDQAASSSEVRAGILDQATLALSAKSKRHLMAVAATVSPVAITRGLEAWTAGGFDDRLNAIEADTLVVASDDPFLPVALLQTEVADKIGRARLVTVAGAGHYTLAERPKELAALVGDFLA